MQDVFFLEWCVNEGDRLAAKQQVGNVESSKATSDLFAPVAGTLLAINQETLKDPSLINSDGDERGWLFEMASDAAESLDVRGYFEFLTATWENTQRILKGQIGGMDD